MAKIQPIYACAFLLALISCHGILFTEGRQMKSINKQSLGFGRSAAVNEKDDFRPTTPGNNSPGVGHSFVKSTEVIESASKTGVHGSQTMGSHHSTVGLNTYDPPTPPAQIPNDHSVAGNQGLGFGHSAAVSEEDDFQPTTPGNNSPGVGHRFVESREDTEPAEVNSPPNRYPQDRSTSPGHSPGVGHSFQNRIAEPNA